MVDRADVAKAVGDRLGLAQIEARAGRALADLGRDTGRPLGVASGDDNVPAARGVGLGEPPSDPGGAADDDDRSVAHCGDDRGAV